VPGLPVLALAALVAAGPPADAGEAEPGDDLFWARAGLSLRFTAQAALPSTAVLFDPAASAFAIARYLAPGPAESYASGLLFASAGIDATEWLGFRLDVDSGLLRQQRLPSAVSLCLTDATPSGLAVAARPSCRGSGGGNAGVLLPNPVPSTQAGPWQLTSNGLPFADELEKTLLVRQLYADLSLGRAGFFHARIGRQRLRVADGLVYDDWGLGVDLDADLGALGPPIAAGLSAFYPTRGWPSGSQWSYPVLALSVDWLPSLGEWLGVWAAFSRDDAGDVSQILRQGFVETGVVRLLASAPGSAEYVRASRSLALLLPAPPRGTSTLGWAGISARLEVGERDEARFTGGAVFGSASSFLIRTDTAVPTVEAVDVPVLGWMASLRWSSQIGRGFTLSPFLVWLSGDEPADERELTGAAPQRYTGFLAVSPFLTATNLFFSGGISESYADRRATSSGVNARGVIAPGLEAGWAPARGLDARLKMAWLWSDRVGPFGGRSYGPEVDLNVGWSPWPWLAVLGEADVLVLGSFFPEGAVARRFILGLDLRTP